MTEATINENAPDLLYCPVEWPSLLPDLRGGLYVMTHLEYRRLLLAGRLDGRYVEVWAWRARVSKVLQVLDGREQFLIAEVDVNNGDDIILHAQHLLRVLPS